MLLFWLESAIIGFFNILKMLKVNKLLGLFYSIFFCGHYGAFMAGHLLFIFGLFIEDGANTSIPIENVTTLFITLWPAILALVLSHGFSFMDNFLGKKEYETTSLKTLMHKPYSRIIVMHITIIAGGFLVLALKAKAMALVLLIVFKMISDMKAHKKEHALKVAHPFRKI